MTNTLGESIRRGNLDQALKNKQEFTRQRKSDRRQKTACPKRERGVKEEGVLLSFGSWIV